MINRAIIAQFSFLSLVVAAFLFAAPLTYAAGTTTVFSHNYQLWDANSDVLLLQQFLNAHGFIVSQSGAGSPGQETTTFGPGTYHALMQFQNTHGLPATGFFGPLTRAVFNSDDLASSTAVQTTAPTTTFPTGAVFSHALIEGQSGADITELQQVLIRQGFLGAGDDTGYFGPLTQKAVAAFQAAHNIDPLGGVGPLTRVMLNSLLSTSASSQHTSSTILGTATTTASTTPNSKPLPGYQPGQLIFGGGGGGGGGSSGGAGGGGGSTPADTTPPSTPTNLTATVASANQINLTWTASTDNVAVTGYNVYRDGTLAGTASTNSYADTGLSPSTIHSYWVAANDAAGNVSTSSAAVSAVTNYGADQYGTTWKPLAIGAGGFITGIDIAPEDTMVARTDTDGAYLWDGTRWDQLVTSTSMPADVVIPSDGMETYEIRIAPSNSNVMYMEYDGYVFVSTNRGSTWTQTPFTQTTVPAIANAYRFWGQLMAVDPNNSNVVYVGTPQNGLFVTTNGGATWQNVSSVPTGTVNSNGSYAGISGIEFDPALGVSGGETTTIFAASPGNSVYESTTTGATWTSIGGPTQVVYSAVSSTGAYYAVDNTNDLWRYTGGTWTNLFSSSGGIETVSVDPFNANEIVISSANGYMNVSYDGGSTWSGYDTYFNGSSFYNQLSSTDVPWLANTGPFMSIGGMLFDQTVQNKLWATGGVGVWTTTSVPSSGFTPSTHVTWNDQSLGIEQLVANDVLVPPGGNPVLASDDRPLFYKSTLDGYPSAYSPVMGDNIIHGWSIDYASSNPNFIAGLADNFGSGNEESAYSTNGGQTWTSFPTFIPGADSSFLGGTIAASTPTNIIWAPADGFDPFYTLDGGNTWNAISLPGVSSWAGFDFAYYLDTRTVTADRVLANTFYLYYAGNGVYKTANGGQTWTQVFTGSISSGSNFNAQLESVPGESGNLFFTGGLQTVATSSTAEGFYQSTNGGATWTAIPNVTEVNTFGFGKAAPGTTTPAIYIVGWVANVYGVWESDNDAQSWTQVGQWPLGSLDQIKTISGDMNAYGRVYLGTAGNGYFYGATANAQIPPSISSISSGSPATTSASIAWSTDQSSNSEVVFGTTAAYGSTSSNALFVTSHSIALTGLASGATYHFEVVSANSQGYTSTSTDQTFTTFNPVPPSVPTGLAATATSSTEIDLSWSASTGNGTYPVAGYQIFQNGTQIATTSSTTYADTGLAASTNYSFTITAYDTANNVSAQSGSVSTTTQAGVTFIPTASPSIQNIAFGTSTATFSGVNIGTATSSRIVVVGVGNGAGNSDGGIASVTIGSTPATEATTSDPGQDYASLWYATVPTGTSADIVVATPGAGPGENFGFIGILVGEITGASSSVPTATGVHSSSVNAANPQVIPYTGTVAVPHNGAAVIIGNGAPSCTPPIWTNTTSASGDYYIATSSGNSEMLAHSYAAGSESYSVEGPGGTFGGCRFGGFAGVVAVWR